MESEIDVEFLITLVSNRPVLWEKSLEEYKSRTETAAAWREVFQELNPNFQNMQAEEMTKYGKSVISKWTNIRDRQVKYLKKLEDEKGTGSAAKSSKKYIYSDQLSFLQKNTTRNTTTSSMDDEKNGSPKDTSGGEILENKTDNEEFCNPVFFKSTQKRKRPKSEMTDIERSILQKLQQPEDRHISFFKGILPSLQKLDDTETIQFQVRVLNILQNIHRSRPRLPSMDVNIPSRYQKSNIQPPPNYSSQGLEQPLSSQIYQLPVKPVVYSSCSTQPGSSVLTVPITKAQGFACQPRQILTTLQPLVSPSTEGCSTPSPSLNTQQNLESDLSTDDYYRYYRSE